jgi:DNA-binding NtrC family response regulator
LNVASITIPPLRERKDEIVPLAKRFVIKHGRQNGAELPELPAPLQQALRDYPWPGNVRELENVIRKFLVFRQAETLAAELSTRTAESNHASGRGGPVRIMPRSLQAAAPIVRNGSNGKESVTAFSAETGFGNGATASAPSRIHAVNSNGSLHENGREQDLHADYYPLYGKANGHSTEYSQPSARHPEPLRDSAGHDAGAQAFARETEQITDDATTPSRLSFAPAGHDFEDDENAADDRQELHQEIEPQHAKGAEPVSTLAQVEELSKEFERRTILAALQRSTWNRKKAAKILEIDYKGLLYKMKKLEIGLNGSGD